MKSSNADAICSFAWIVCVSTSETEVSWIGAWYREMRMRR